MDWVAPRSTRIHCGSTPCALAQRVPRLPSTALAQTNCGVGEQVTGLFNARLVPPVGAVAVRVGVALGPMGVWVRVGVRVGVKVGPVGVLVRVAVLVGVKVGPMGVWVRVGVRVGVRVTGVVPVTPMILISF